MIKPRMKCMPGVVCLENYTIIFMLLLLAVALYMLYTYTRYERRGTHHHSSGHSFPHHSFPHHSSPHHSSPHHSSLRHSSPPVIVDAAWMGGLSSIPTRTDPFNDPYMPPLKFDGPFYTTPTIPDIRGAIPINIKTRGTNADFAQVGILTRKNGTDDMILPLMGSRLMTGRDKWTYYTISNNGNINTKLPISVAGRSCTNEYGCDEIYNKDTVYVEGYKDVFEATVYENGTFSYLPVL